MTIVSIRGTHGSGKSTIVQRILGLYDHKDKWQPINPDKKGRVEGYLLQVAPKQRLAIIGSYHTQCGGADGIQPYSLILDRIADYAKHYEHVLLEGALVSSSYGSVGQLMSHYAPNAVFAFLDTPLELCLERIKQRRAAKGNFEPLNPHNTTVKFENVARTKDQMRRLGSQVRIVDIRHTHAVTDVLKLFGVRLSKEPA